MKRATSLLFVVSTACASAPPPPAPPPPSEPAVEPAVEPASESASQSASESATADAESPETERVADADDGAATVDEARCQAAFDHMTDVSTREIERLPPEEKKMALEIAAKTSENDGERRQKFVAKCAEGAIDIDCIMRADDTMSYIGCFSSMK
jgi:hypothetical protein